MEDESRLTSHQLKQVKALGLKDWQLWSIHTNGDVTIREGTNYYRITTDGIIVSKWSEAGHVPRRWYVTPEKAPKEKEIIQPPLMELPKEAKKKEKEAEKKPKYDINSKQQKLMAENGQPEILRQLSNKDLIVKLKGEEWIFGYDGISLSKKEFDKKYGKGTEYKGGYGYAYPSKTLCQESPECCLPRVVKSVYWDADHTIWELTGTAALVTGPLRKLDDNTVVEISHTYGQPLTEEKGYQLTKTEQKLLEGLSPDEKDFLIKELKKEHGEVKQDKEKEYVRTTIKLDPTFRQTLDELEKKNIKSSIISLNSPGSVSRILKEFGIDQRFEEIRDSYDNKGKVFKELTHKQGICPCDALFIDDYNSNVQSVADKCGIALQIGKGKDIQQTIDVLKFIA